MKVSFTGMVKLDSITYINANDIKEVGMGTNRNSTSVDYLAYRSKVGRGPDEAVAQIKTKEYMMNFEKVAALIGNAQSGKESLVDLTA